MHCERQIFTWLSNRHEGEWIITEFSFFVWTYPLMSAEAWLFRWKTWSIFFLCAGACLLNRTEGMFYLTVKESSGRSVCSASRWRRRLPSNRWRWLDDETRICGAAGVGERPWRLSWRRPEARLKRKVGGRRLMEGAWVVFWVFIVIEWFDERWKETKDLQWALYMLLTDGKKI